MSCRWRAMAVVAAVFVAMTLDMATLDMGSSVLAAPPTEPPAGETPTTTIAPAVADLRLTGQSDMLAHVPGPQATFSFVLHNDGPDPATSLQVAVTVPEGVPFWPGPPEAPISMGIDGVAPTACTSDTGDVWICPVNGVGGGPVDLPAGSSTWFFVYLDVSNLPLGTVATVTARADSSTDDPDTGNNAVAVPYTVSPWADVGIGLSAGSPQARLRAATAEFDLVFEIVNRGPHRIVDPVLNIALWGTATPLEVTVRLEHASLAAPPCTVERGPAEGPGAGATTVLCELGAGLDPTGGTPIVARVRVRATPAREVEELWGAAWVPTRPGTTALDPNPFDNSISFRAVATAAGSATGVSSPTGTDGPSGGLPVTGGSPWLPLSLALTVLGIGVIARRVGRA